MPINDPSLEAGAKKISTRFELARGYHIVVAGQPISHSGTKPMQLLFAAVRPWEKTTWLVTQGLLSKKAQQPEQHVR